MLWTALTATDDVRGSSISSYHLQWDKGSSGANWYDLTGFVNNYQSTSFIVTTDLSVGQPFLFRVRAKNAYGFGDYSTPATIRTSDKPETMVAVTTSVEDDTYVRITWVAPYDNSEPIEAYQILIQQSNGAYSEHTGACNGAVAPIKTQLYCDIPMASLRGLPYNLPQKALVVARATAKNVIGWSALSLPNTSGARIQVVPYQVSAPTRGSQTNEG